MSYARTSLKGINFYDSSKAYKGFTLVTPADGTGAWLIDMMGNYVNHWKIPFSPAYDAKLLPNGNLLYAGKTKECPLGDVYNGGGGILLEVDWNSNVVWEYKDPHLHHSFHRQENGNTVVLKWVRISKELAAKVRGGDAGTEKNGIMWGDTVQEISPKGEIIWEWIAHEHLDVEKTPRCILCPRDTWAHGNSVWATPNGDILVSFAKLNTVVLIERATGRIKWQWGPGNIAHQQCVTMLDQGTILIFDTSMHANGFAFSSSKVLEIDPTCNEVVWDYGGGDKEHWADWWGRKRPYFFSAILGSSQRLPNGNTLICEGMTGRILEVNPGGEVVWEFSNNLPSYEPYPAQTRSHMVCSAYRYGVEYKGLKDPIPLAVEKQRAPSIPSSKKTKSQLESERKTSVAERLAFLGY
jgi:hypothetical protein